jgi:galactokinase
VATFAPGRVNLIGDHTDYMGGLAMPMAIQMGTTVRARRGGSRVELVSDEAEGTLRLELPVTDAAAVAPSWGRYVAGVAQELNATVGLEGGVTSDLPIGAGLSSSASLEVAAALALGAPPGSRELAELCQRAEQSATGMPCGIMDQLAIVAGVSGHALRLDCATLEIRPVPVPETARFWVVHSGEQRRLVGSEYATRRAQAEAAQRAVGPLRVASATDIESLEDPVLRRRARHVHSECTRVDAFADALARGDLISCGALMDESHTSLRDDYEVSTEALDRLVERLRSTAGVHGARLTGAGFGGCVVALADPGVELDGWQVQPGGGASVLSD